ncbi:MAG: sel1 repeat family protein [Chloroflexi bacterium]|nr:sel1 repeat family protein [Chloroflexota bacterium]
MVPMIHRVAVPVGLALGVLLSSADSAWSQARPPSPPAKAATPPALSVRLLKVGMVAGWSARGLRPYGPKASAVVVEIAAPSAGLMARIDQTTTTATVGTAVLPATYVFIVGGDSAIVDAVATREAVAWETAIGTASRLVLGPAVRPVLDLRQGDWIEYRFTRSGMLRLAVVFDEYPAAMTNVVIAGSRLDFTRPRIPLTGQWRGTFAWRGVIGQLQFTVDSVSSEIGDLDVGFTLTDSAGRRRPGLPRLRPDLLVSIPVPLAPIGARGTFAFYNTQTRLGGTGRFVTADSAVGTFTGTEKLGIASGPGVALRGPWVARRSAPSVPPRSPYAFRVDTVVAPFLIRDARLYQPACREVRDTAVFVFTPAQGGFNVSPPGGQMEMAGGSYCIWPHGAVHQWVGSNDAVQGVIRSIRSDGTMPLRFRVHRDSGYVYVSGKGTLTTTSGEVVELPLGARLVGTDPEIATLRRTSAAAEREARAVEEHQRNCRAGDMAGCYSLGLAHADGRGVPQNDSLAAEFYRQACDGGHMAACDDLGAVYEGRPGAAPDHTRAAELYRQACDGGHMPGCAHLGSLLEFGRGVPQSSTRAVELFQQACDGGAMSGCAGLGGMFGVGHGVKLDDARAVELYRQACDGAFAPGCADLGGMYAVGRGVAQNDTTAAALYRKACDGGSTAGCVNLGWTVIFAPMYSSVAVPSQRVTDAVELFERACDRGNVVGCVGLGSMYRSVRPDRARSDEFFRRACDDGYLRGCHDLAMADYRSQDPVEDRTISVPLATRACDGGYMAACGSLAVAFEGGYGVAQDHTRALEYRRQACDGGWFLSCEIPEGVAWPARLLSPADRDKAQKNYARTAERYRRACDGGDAAECYHLGIAYFAARGFPENRANRQRAVELFRQACDGGFMQACASLGWILEAGLDVAQNHARAADLMQRACDGGHTAACTWLRGLPPEVRR